MTKRKWPIRPANPGFTSLIIALTAGLVLFVLVSAAVSPDRLDLNVGDVAPKTITATKDVEDTIATKELQEAAARAVQPSYTSDETVMGTVMDDLREAFGKMVSFALLDQAADGSSMEITSAMRRQAAAELAPVEVDESVIDAVIQTDQATLQSLANIATKYVRETLSSKLPEGQEAEAVAKIKRDLQNEGFSDDLVSVATAIVSEYIQPNMLLDEETTEQNRQKAQDDVEPVIYKKGQNIVRGGEPVTQNQIEMLNSLGMLANMGFDFALYCGVALMVALMSLGIYVYLLSFEPESLVNPMRIALLCTICVTVLGLSLLVRGLSSFLMPVSLGVMLVTLLMKPRLAILVNILLAVLAGIISSSESGVFSSNMFSVMLGAIVAGPVCVTMLRRKQQRFNILVTGLVVSLLNMTATFAIGLISSVDTKNVLIWALWSGGSGILSAILCIGLQPALEWAFNLVTNVKLMELANPNQPILRRLMLEAPGTYHHSIIVANLAEAAASAVGANALLARVGAYYHDIGKLKRPMYFKENQIHDNPHDRTDPRVSTAIVTAHPRDGVELARKGRLPEPIQQIIQQHHGDTLVVYFYDKAVRQGLDVDPAQFRYDGPRPKEKEAAIVMLADTVEAAARAMRDEATQEKLNELIRKLVRGKMEDGQLDECRLTFADIHLICEAFSTVLTGVYHERIEYPNVVIPQRIEAERTETPADAKEDAEAKGEDCLPEHMREEDE